MSRSRNRIPPRERAIKCEKSGSCLDNFGVPLSHCTNAPSYFDYAFPASENICSRSAESVVITNVDPYKRTYVEASRNIDATIANIHLSPRKISERFKSIESALEEIVYFTPRYDDKGDIERLITKDGRDLLAKGRLSYHVSARMLHASLGLYAHRALNRDQPFGENIMRATDIEYAKILSDFDEDGIYALHPEIVAHKRTEVSLAKILSRTMRSENFFLPALYREEASRTEIANHDGVIFSSQNTKIAVEVKNSDYPHRKTRRPISDIYTHLDTVLFIHQDVVELDYREGVLIEQHVAPSSPTVHTDDVPFPHEQYDPDANRRYIRWGASGPKLDEEELESFVFTQQIAGNRGNELMRALIAEAFGQRLTLDQMNILNGASHYLISVIRQTIE